MQNTCIKGHGGAKVNMLLCPLAAAAAAAAPEQTQTENTEDAEDAEEGDPEDPRSLCLHLLIFILVFFPLCETWTEMIRMKLQD